MKSFPLQKSIINVNRSSDNKFANSHCFLLPANGPFPLQSIRPFVPHHVILLASQNGAFHFLHFIILSS
ncbi:hypothetical protein C1H46_018260 [Malus baccata]|uniref:Uncharacterized protein n=1 Tax=Malus baccata TaxID=106549 RepID=A0A540MBJ9_MALBA|nr:hypothetical protein C1H46_018260 [Malus baccata]